ncbi:MAG: ABC transporter substrate-binding protein [Planctomycetota bacterium]
MITTPRSGRSGLALSIAVLALAGVALFWRGISGTAAVVAEARESALRSTASPQDPSLGPGLQPVDAFHPDRRPGKDGTLPPLPQPAFGGRVIIHLDSNPRHLCAAIDNSAITRRILLELNETLLLRDWETTEWRPDLAIRYEVQDRIVMKSGPPSVGAVTERGSDYVVDGTARVPKDDVQRVLPGTVLTFSLRPGVKWHDGHAFDARDVAFSFRIYKNEKVDCGEKRARFLKFEGVEVLDERTVRFTCSEPYFNALETIAEMCILPAHLYDLSDPDNEDGQKRRAADPAYRPSDEEQGRYVNENPHNRDWVGLGPYRLKGWTADGLEAERFEGYFDPENAGYFDAIRWRAIPGTDAAFQAVIQGELDFMAFLTSQDYFGESTQAASFTDRCYKGYFYAANFWYVGWNLYRPQLADVRVRRAIAMTFDFDAFKKSFYKGLAVQVTGSASVYSPGYDRELAPLPLDRQRAAELLDEAGWTDRDGDQVRDRDGVPLDFSILLEPNDKVGAAFGAKLQEDLSKVGIRLRIQTLDRAAIGERRRQRDFEAFALGWAPPLESDPEQLWHSRGGAKDVVSSNFTGLQDGRVDELIGKGQRELDPRKRAEIWKELHRRIYELQPYLFCYNSPRKFAMNKAIRGFQSVPVDPNYVVRRWYYPAGTPGTRPTLSRSPEGAGGGGSPPRKDGSRKGG